MKLFQSIKKKVCNKLYVSYRKLHTKLVTEGPSDKNINKLLFLIKTLNKMSCRKDDVFAIKLSKIENLKKNHTEGILEK